MISSPNGVRRIPTQTKFVSARSGVLSLIAGSPPLDPTLPAAALLAAAQSGERQSLRETRPQTPKDLAAIVDKCLAAEKARRYQSVAELDDDLSRWLAGEPVRARTAAPFYWLGKKVRRHWIAVAAGVTLIFSAAGLAWGYLHGQQALEQQQRQVVDREAAQTARTLHEAHELVAQLLVEMRSKFEEAGHPEWIEEAEKRVAGFPWDVGGSGAGAWDPRRFRGRSALVQGDVLSVKSQWGNALNAYHEAISQLKTLVTEQPDVPIFREELARARIGEAFALVQLRFHKEAFAAAEKALHLLEPRPGESVPPAIWAAMVDAACALSQAARSANQKGNNSRELMASLVERLPGGAEPGQMTAEQADWHSRILCELTRLTLLGNTDARLAEPSAVKAVVCARRAGEVTDGGEMALRRLATALAVEGDVARRLEESARVIVLLNEASEILLNRLDPPSPTLSAAPYEAAAGGWEELALYLKRLGDDTKVPSYYSWASDASGEAVRLWECLRHHKKDKRSLAALSRLSLRNVLLLRLDGKNAEGLPWATRTVRHFEIAVKENLCATAIAMNAAEAALLMFEMKIPERSGKDRSWKESARLAMKWVKESRRSLNPEDRQRESELEKRLAALGV